MGFQPHLHLGRVEPACQRALLLWIVQFLRFKLIGILLVWFQFVRVIFLGIVVFRFGLFRLVIGIVIKFRLLLRGCNLSIRRADPADRY